MITQSTFPPHKMRRDLVYYTHMYHSARQSLKIVLVSALISACMAQSSVSAVDHTFQDLANNEKAVYTLPEPGSILPNNPLFQIKRLRDEATLAVTFGPERVKLLIALSDRYTVYGVMMAQQNKPQVAFQMFAQALRHQEALIDILSKSNKGSKKTMSSEMCALSMQSNIKHAEVMRELLSELSATDQPALAMTLDTNMSHRKALAQCAE